MGTTMDVDSANADIESKVDVGSKSGSFTLLGRAVMVLSGWVFANMGGSFFLTSPVLSCAKDRFARSGV